MFQKYPKGIAKGYKGRLRQTIEDQYAWLNQRPPRGASGDASVDARLGEIDAAITQMATAVPAWLGSLRLGQSYLFRPSSEQSIV